MTGPETVIILAGGRGTRLRPVLSDLPKPLAPVAGRPFLAWQLDGLASQGIRKVVLSTGFMSDLIRKEIGHSWSGMDIIHVPEPEPLGTGGGILNAWAAAGGTTSYVMNGDTYTDFHLKDLWAFHRSSRAMVTLALHRISDAGRYGTVRIDGNGSVTGFHEKQAGTEGWINAGVYVLEPSIWKGLVPGEVFSFETDILAGLDGGRCAGLPVPGHFLDIGIPEDYDRAQTDLPAWNAMRPVATFRPDRSWTLFLDRDGVLNRRIPGDYVRTPEQFEWLPGVVDALAGLRERFGRLVVVTNQQGIGRGWMSSVDLEAVHHRMVRDLKAAGVVLDGIYFCPGLAADDPVCRKPLPGLALQALADHPSIRMDRSLMVGDSDSDIEFGRRLGMETVRIGPTIGEAGHRFDDLPGLRKWLDTLD